MLDRTVPPPFQAVQDVRLPNLQTHTLDNGILLHRVPIAGQPVVRLECIFEAGAWEETVPMSSFFTLKMLAEGTSHHTSAQISEFFDSYGAFLELHSGADRASIVVHSLTKFLPKLLPMIGEMVADSTFPKKELADLQTITVQNLRINYEKNAYTAGVKIRENLFGEKHPYGRPQRIDWAEDLKRADIQTFYEKAIRGRAFEIWLAGQVSELEVEFVNQTLGQLPVSAEAAPAEGIPFPFEPKKEDWIEKADSLQSSIRIGRRLFTRNHPDYFPALVANEVLGGYFGSRLMKNIREDKGYTYGISSGIHSLRHAGYFTIGTDVKRENTNQTLDEIRTEIRKLQTQPVPESELSTVKNFMAGEFVGSLTNAFDIADRYKTVWFDELPADFLHTYISHLHAVTPEEVMLMANRYFDESNLSYVVVGGR